MKTLKTYLFCAISKAFDFLVYFRLFHDSVFLCFSVLLDCVFKKRAALEERSETFLRLQNSRIYALVNYASTCHTMGLERAGE